MLNIVVPMAGQGKRFVDAGYDLPKPLIPVHGVPMIRLVMRNVRPSGPHRFVFVVQQDHLARYPLERVLRDGVDAAHIVPLPGVTQGPACSVLAARDLIDGDDPLMVVNSDQWVAVDIDAYLDAMDRSAADGFIMTMKADHPKWSYVRFDAAGRVCELVEKQVVSDEATVGIYNFRQGASFVRAADRMIAQERRVGGEFYVAPAYNELLREGARVECYNVGAASDGMYGLGTPEDLRHFLALPLSRRAAGQP